MFSKLSTLALAGAASVTAFAAGAQAQPGPGLTPGLTQTCAFRDGPRAGQTINFAGAPGAVSVPIGARCADMQGSSGLAIAPATAREQVPGRYYLSPGAPNAWESTGGLRQGFTLTCRFDSGPRAGTTLNYANTLGAEPVAIGSPCSEGPSRGVAVAGPRM
jgi:hypothetical protein